jgi:hypothetical protein
VDPQRKVLTVAPLMMVNQRDHDVKFSNHIQVHRIKHKSIGCRIKLDKIENCNDAPPHTDGAAVWVNDLWELIVFIPVETHIIILYCTVELGGSILYS